MKTEHIQSQLTVIEDCRRLSRSLLDFAELSVTSFRQFTDSSLPQSGVIDELIQPKQAAKLLNVSLSLLEKWRRSGRGVAWVRLEGQRAIRYRRSDILKFIAERSVK